MVLNSLSFCLSAKLFISLLNLNESLTLLSILGCSVFPLSSLEMYCATPFWLAEFLLKTQRITLWVFPVHNLSLFPCCFQYFFFVFNFCQFDYCVSWYISPWVYPVWDSLGLLDLIDYFLFHIGEIFNYNIFKKFVIPFLFLFFFWDPYNQNVGMFDTLSEVSETVLSSFQSFCLILLFRSYFYLFIIKLTDSSFCFRYSAIDSFQSIFNFSNCVVCLCMFIL